MNIKFSPKNQYSMKMYWSKNTDKYSVLYDENDQKYYLRIWEDNSWHYPFWAQDGFDTIKDVEDFLCTSGKLLHIEALKLMIYRK